jgi:hypothetical protein
MIASDIFEDEFIGDLNYFERLLWIGIITSVADDQGRLMDNPALIRSKVFLFDTVKDSEVETALNKIYLAGKIARYVDGNKSLIQIVNWWKYQTPSWASQSKYKPPKGWTDRAKYHGTGNKIVTVNWDKDGGYVAGYVAPNVADYPTPLDRPIEEKSREEISISENLDDDEDEYNNDEPFRILFDAFLEATNMHETMLNGAKAVDEITKRWIPGGVTPDEVRNAAKELLSKDYNISGPWSLTNSINMLKAKGSKKVDKPVAWEVFG